MQDQRQGLLLGNTYLDKLTAAAVAIDFLLLPILFSSGKLDDSLSFALNAISVSLPFAGCYFVMRLSVEVNRLKWQAISDRFPWRSGIFKVFFFLFLPLVGSNASNLAVFYTIDHFSRVASLFIFFSIFIIFLFIFLFLLMFSRIFLLGDDL